MPKRISDKERIDWLEQNGRGIGWTHKSPKKGVTNWKVDWESGDESVYTGSNIRAAIDAAIAAERKAGKKGRGHAKK